MLGSARSYPSTTYATVTHGHGCEWNIENDVIQQHTDHRDVCGIAGLLTQIDQGRSVSFFGETEGFTYVCAPPLVMGRSGLVPGATFTTPCGDGHGNNAVCHETYLGPEQVQVGGVTEPALHAVIDGVLTGVATGTTHDDLVLDASTGMILSWIRSVSTDASAAFGVKAHYSEHASFTLLNLVPQT